MLKQLFTYKFIILLAVIVSNAGCNNPSIEHYTTIDSLPPIKPDYTSITIPPNIAPLNFNIEKNAEDYLVRITVRNQKPLIIHGKQKIRVPEPAWRNMLNTNKGKHLYIDVFMKTNHTWQKYKTIENQVATEPIDRYLAYRLIEPLYVNWKSMGIYQRCMENFDEKPILHNNLTEGQCMNCHSFQQNNTENMLLHLRGKNGGTLIIHGNQASKVNTKTDSSMSPGVYPAWHPHKKLVAFSVNETGQLFHSRNTEKIEVLDTRSDLVLYNIDKNEISPVMTTDNYFETFPTWSPDGQYLYFCRTACPTDRPVKDKYRPFDISDKYADIKYDILRIKFDENTLTFGKTDTVFMASRINKSASFPRISPDGKFLLFCLSDYGNFSIWHKSSDLYLLNLQTNVVKRLDNINSNEADSYHTWSSNGRWFVFSSRRIDGSYTRPYFAYFDKDGTAHKPFILPQKDPDFYEALYTSYNVPELIESPVKTDQHQLEKVARQKAVPVKYVTKK
jgi:hypothetical protein